MVEVFIVRQQAPVLGRRRVVPPIVTPIAEVEGGERERMGGREGSRPCKARKKGRKKYEQHVGTPPPEATLSEVIKKKQS